MIRRAFSCGAFCLLSGSLSSVFLFSGNLSFERWPSGESGIDWVHDNGKSLTHYLPETMGAGLAAFDYEQDGLMDLYFVNSG